MSFNFTTMVMNCTEELCLKDTVTRNYAWHFLLSTLFGHFLITGESLSDLQYEVKQLLRSHV